MPAKGSSKVDIDKLKVFCRLKPTLEDCAAFFEVNTSTIERTIKRYNGLTFAEFRKQNMVHTRHSLVQKAIKMALEGHPAMLIFCLKNLCGWVDKQEVSGAQDKPIELNYKIEK